MYIIKHIFGRNLHDFMRARFKEGNGHLSFVSHI